MLEIFIGIIMGFLAGLGVGGGTLLILWLTIVNGMYENTARAINLMFFLASAGSITAIRWKRGKLNWKEILPAVISGCVAAAIFSWGSMAIDKDILRKMFGIILLFAGVKELLSRPRNAK